MDPEISIAFEDQRAVLGVYGASLRRYFRISSENQEIDICWGYSGKQNKRGGQGDVLVPFPGRLKDGRYSFAGKEYQLPLNDKDGPNAIHGFLRAVDWIVAERSESSVVFHAKIRPWNEQDDKTKGYPFSVDFSLRYELSRAGLACRFFALNSGDVSLPIGVGFHPYFLLGGETIDPLSLTIPCERLIEFENLLPTGRVLEVEGGKWDFLRERPIGNLRFNHCYSKMRREADGRAIVRLFHPSSGHDVRVWMDRAFEFVVIYSGDALGVDARRALAIEPMTCGTDAFNHPEWGLRILAPGEEFQGSWGVSAT